MNMLRRHVAVVAAVGITAVLFAGCSQDASDLLNFILQRNHSGDTAQNGADPRLARQAPEPALVEANTAFAFDLYHTLAADDSAANTFISPASVSIALSMTYGGADNATRDSMAQVLRYSALSADVLDSANQILLSNLVYGDERVTLELANSLWGKIGVPFIDDFVDRNVRYYDAGMRLVDMSDPATLGIVNGWISEKTHGTIPETLRELSPATVLLLINAIYFNGTWTYQFDRDRTTESPFHLANGADVTVPMMEMESRAAGTEDKRLRYLEGDTFQAVSLPYGEDGRFSMYVFLPEPTSSLSEFTAGLTPEAWRQWMAGFARKEGTLRLPRFSLEYEAELKATLTAMGMGIAFDGARADFGRMIDIEQRGPVWIDKVIHKTFLDVNEEGTEAAGVTVVVMVESSIGDIPFTMTVDRPFFLSIVDNETGTILFMGGINNPS